MNFIKYNTPVANAKSLQNQGHYAEAFSELNGLTMKEKDMELLFRPHPQAFAEFIEKKEIYVNIIS